MTLLIWLLMELLTLIIGSIAVGSYDMSAINIVRTILGLEEGPHRIVVWGIRMPRITASIITGCGLRLSGLATQSLLRNPLASPFTLGISQGAAFGAAFSIVVLGAAGMQQSALRIAEGTHGIESTETIYAPFEWVQAKNIAKSGGEKGHLFVDKEKILEWDPDIVFIDSGGNELVREDYVKKPDFYRGLKAFKNRQVHLLHSFNWYMTNLGTVIADAYAVGKILFPKRFTNVTLTEKADEIYGFLLGKPVYRQLAESFGNLGDVPKYLQQ